ncbi:MAG: DoxX family protein [Paludibacteraceae bacterium]|nr:DoxX family protein [Paludibacteraceae bacterium]
MKSKVQHVTGSIARSLLGLTFLFSGFVKAIDPLGTTYKIEDYLKAFGGFFADMLPLAQTAAFILIAAEFVLAICLLLNVRTSITSWLTLLFYLVMTPLTAYIAITNPVSDCGCFGDALVITNWQTFTKNVILLVLSIVLVKCRKSIPSTFVWQAELGIASLALVLVVGLMAWTLNHLPFIDFRPYKIGNNIPELMEYPEDAPQDEYEITFVYEKNGVEQEFTLENYPRGDSSWTFVRQNSKLIKKGYEPPIHDFELINNDFEDITFDILESEEPVTLVIMYDLSKSDMEMLPRVERLYEQTMESGSDFYILTGSGSDEIDALVSQLSSIGREAICTCDPVTLKTIVRANPGVIEVQNGIVINKFNLKNICE